MYSVSIITPTTYDREAFNQRIADIVQKQDYPNIIEHLFDYSDITLGTKRNRLCEAAKGDVILHFDSDDMYTSDWTTKSVQSLIESKASCTGLSSIRFWDGYYMRLYTSKSIQTMLAGATMCYWRETWQRTRFKDVVSGEDTDFIARCGKVSKHHYIDGFLATLHGNNTSSHLNLHAKEFSFITEGIDKILSKF